MNREPFGHLGTDEPTSEWSEPPRRKDQDRALMSGCLVVSWSSLLVMVCLALPFAVVQPQTDEAVLNVALIGGIAGGAVGLAFVWIGAIAGFCGSVAGICPAAVFIWLRLRELALGMPGIPGMEPASYDVSLSWFTPLGLSLVLASIWGVALYFRLKLEGRIRRDE